MKFKLYNYKNLLISPVIIFSIYKYITEKNIEFLYLSVITLAYLISTYFIEFFNNKSTLLRGREKNFNKIEIEELNRKILNQEEIIKTLNREVLELNKQVENKKKEIKDINKNCEKNCALQTLSALIGSIRAKDNVTGGHSQRVMDIACKIGERLGYEGEDFELLKYASMLHDIGKIGIPEEILNKPGSLTDEEFEEIKKHPIISVDILKDLKFFKKVLEPILQHHERFDGKGYPHGIEGEKINIFARILSVADAFDAMISDRPYRKALKVEQALEELNKYKGTQFDPKIVELVFDMYKEGLIDKDE